MLAETLRGNCSRRGRGCLSPNTLPLYSVLKITNNIVVPVFFYIRYHRIILHYTSSVIWFIYVYITSYNIFIPIISIRNIQHNIQIFRKTNNLKLIEYSQGTEHSSKIPIFESLYRCIWHSSLLVQYSDFQFD